MSTRTALCPQCRKPAELAPSNLWRPFCSERCKLLDLGDWMDGRFSIPLAEADDVELPPTDERPPH